MSDYDEDVEIAEEDYALEDEDGNAMVDEEGGEEGDENLAETTYYDAKASLETDINEALESFQTVLDMEEEKGQWGFKSLKQLCKALLKLNKTAEFTKRFKQLLDYMSVVSRNDSEKAINKMLNLVSSSTDRKLLDNIYTVTLDALLKSKNDKLWFSTKLKQGNLLREMRDFAKLSKVIEELRASCLLPDGSEDPKKGSNLLDIYVLEIQMHTEQNETKKLKRLYEKCMQVATGAVVLNPRMIGVIRECGGKMFMKEKQWNRAHEDFFEAFKSYDEAGNPRRLQCLKYLVLANILMSSTINPFEANEVKPYKNHPEIQSMNNLIQAYQQSDIVLFERTLKRDKTISEDTFMKDYIQDLYKNVRTKVLLRLAKAYTKIKMEFVAKELNVKSDEVEGLCVDLILDQKLDGQIDQINGFVQLGGNKTASTRYWKLAEWSKRLNEVHSAVLSKV